MEYKRDYLAIGFRVMYSRVTNIHGVLSFAAHPHELLLEPGLNVLSETFLIMGRVSKGELLEVGFKDFLFEMTPDFHRRLGALYELVKTEYRNTVVKKV